MSPRVLVDGFGRVVRDLRISVTDRCNFRCAYCMPAEGLDWLPGEHLLTFDEIERLARVCVHTFGVEAIRLTGGEPTLRPRLAELVAALAPLGTDLAMTTNGVRLPTLAAPLRAAGLRRVNISLDSLRRDRFAAITRRDALTKVLAGIEAAGATGFAPVKINVVVQRGVNDDEILDFAAFGRDRGLRVRFIEFMPLDAPARWARDAVVPAHEIIEVIHDRYPVAAVARGSEPAEEYRYLDGGGCVGVISSVSQPFCGSCDRIRLTADGQLRNCLFARTENDLRALLRTGADDDEIAAALSGNVAGKAAGHAINRPDFVRPTRSMSQIGG